MYEGCDELGAITKDHNGERNTHIDLIQVK